MKVLVTGATGFIGTHLVEALEAGDHRVSALARSQRRAEPLARRGIEVFEGDVTDRDAIARACTSVEVVIHAAGLTRARNEEDFRRVNVAGSRLVAECSAKAGARRLILISSLAARGPAGGSGPVSAYGRSKLAGESAVREAAVKPLELVIVRPTAVYGPRDRALLPAFRLARTGLRPILRGGGSLSVIHVRDLARGLAALTGREVPGGSVLEASDGGTYSWHELLASMADAVGRPGRPLELPVFLFQVAAAATDLYTRLSGVPQIFGTDKLREMRASWLADSAPFWQAAGTKPRFDLASGARDTVEAYRQAGWL